MGDRERRSVACGGRGLVWVCEGRFRDVIVVVAEGVRENGDAKARLGMRGSVVGMTESLRFERAEGARPGGCKFCLVCFVAD